MKVALLLCLIAYASATAVDPCSDGQAYWCTSLKTAKKCGAIKHCIDNVWSEQAPYKNDNGDVCQFCENIIGDARNLFSEKNEAKVEKYLDSACGMIPVPELSDKCKDYVKNDIGEVFQLIRSKLDPKAICSCLGLCQSYQDLTHQLKQEPLFSNLLLVKASQDDTKEKPITTTAAGNVCKDCEKLVKDLKAQITSKTTEDQLENLLKQNVCSMLGGLSDECTQLVDTYVPELLQMLQEEVDPTMVCSVLQLCPNGDHSYLVRRRLQKTPLFKAANKLSGTGECDVCKLVMTELRDVDRNTAIQTELEQVIKTKLCPRLGSLMDECIHTVEEYGRFLFEFLANELDPATRCQSLGFCSADNLVSATRKATPVRKVSKPHLAQGPQCVLCEFVMKEVDDLLEDNATEAKIIDVVDKVCNLMPDTIKVQCKDFVNQYGPAIITLLAQELEPEMICATLGLCQSGQTAHKPLQIRKNHGTNEEFCGVCETIIQYVGSLLEENATETQIKQALNKVCNFLPSELRGECRSFVKEYAPELIQLLVQTLDPEQVCKALKLCPAMKKANKPVQMPMTLIKPAKAILVGVNECTYGPAFWCKNADNAKKCGAVAHCQKHAWENGNPPQ